MTVVTRDALVAWWEKLNDQMNDSTDAHEQEQLAEDMEMTEKSLLELYGYEWSVHYGV